MTQPLDLSAAAPSTTQAAQGSSGSPVLGRRSSIAAVAQSFSDSSIASASSASLSSGMANLSLSQPTGASNSSLESSSSSAGSLDPMNTSSALASSSSTIPDRDPLSTWAPFLKQSIGEIGRVVPRIQLPPPTQHAQYFQSAVNAAGTNPSVRSVINSALAHGIEPYFLGRAIAMNNFALAQLQQGITNPFYSPKLDAVITAAKWGFEMMQLIFGTDHDLFKNPPSTLQEFETAVLKLGTMDTYSLVISHAATLKKTPSELSKLIISLAYETIKQNAKALHPSSTSSSSHTSSALSSSSSSSSTSTSTDDKKDDAEQLKNAGGAKLNAPIDGSQSMGGARDRGFQQILEAVVALGNQPTTHAITRYASENHLIAGILTKAVYAREFLRENLENMNSAEDAGNLILLVAGLYHLPEQFIRQLAASLLT